MGGKDNIILREKKKLKKQLQRENQIGQSRVEQIISVLTPHLCKINSFAKSLEDVPAL